MIDIQQLKRFSIRDYLSRQGHTAYAGERPLRFLPFTVSGRTYAQLQGRLRAEPLVRLRHGRGRIDYRPRDADGKLRLHAGRTLTR